jgi:hypothetical protein
MLRGSEKTTTRSPDRRSLRRLQLEPLESRTLLSASPANAAAFAADWSSGDAIQRAPNAEPIAVMVAAVHSLHQDVVVDPSALREQLQESLADVQPAIEAYANPSTNAPVPRDPTDLQAPGHLGDPARLHDAIGPQPVDAQASYTLAPGWPFPGDDHLPQSISQKLQGGELDTWSFPEPFEQAHETRLIDRSGNDREITAKPSGLMPLAPVFVSWQAKENGRLEPGHTDWTGASWEDMHLPDLRFDPNDILSTIESFWERIPLFPMNELLRNRKHLPGGVMPGPLAGQEFFGGFEAIASSAQSNNSAPTDSTVFSTITSSPVQFTTDLDEGGFVTLSTAQDVRAPSSVTESWYNASTSDSLLTDWNGPMRLLPDTTLEFSWRDNPLQTRPSRREFVPSTADDQEGGLIDIDSLREDEEYWARVGALADAAITSDWTAESEEGGMIELAAYHSRDSRSPTAVNSASEHVPSKWRNIRIDKGLGRFRAVEVAEGPSEHAEDDALAKQGMEQDLPVDTTASADSSTPEPSASAGSEPRAETDRHAAAPAIVGLFLSGVGRETSETSPRSRTQKSQAGNRKSV